MSAARWIASTRQYFWPNFALGIIRKQRVYGTFDVSLLWVYVVRAWFLD